MYDNAHNWYAAIEKLGPDVARNELPRSLPPLIQTDRTKGCLRCPKCCGNLDWNVYEDPTL